MAPDMPDNALGLVLGSVGFALAIGVFFGPGLNSKNYKLIYIF
jgi:hypothetical protein